MRLPRFELALTLAALVVVGCGLVFAYLAAERLLGGAPARPTAAARGIEQLSAPKAPAAPAVPPSAAGEGQGN